jgi:hypothetical protein
MLESLQIGEDFSAPGLADLTSIHNKYIYNKTNKNYTKKKKFYNILRNEDTVVGNPFKSSALSNTLFINLINSDLSLVSIYRL